VNKFSSVNPSGGQLNCPPGSHPARVAAIVDLGTQTDEFEGKVRKNPHLYLSFEVYVGDTSYLIARDYNFTLSPKSALRPVVEGVLGRLLGADPFDLNALLGKACLVNLTPKVSNTGKSYSKLVGVSPLPQAMTCPPAEKTPVVWCIGDAFDRLPNWLPFCYGESVQDVILRSPEGQRAASPAGVAAAVEEPIPY
jgi:hypothetical protein